MGEGATGWILGAEIAAAAVLGFWLGGAPVLAWFEQHEQLAAWAQAVGAFVAVRAAYRFAKAESERAAVELTEARALEAARLERDERRHATNLAAVRQAALIYMERAAYDVRHIADELISAADTGQPPELSAPRAALAVSKGRMAAFPLEALEDPLAVKTFVIAVQALDAAFAGNVFGKQRSCIERGSTTFGEVARRVGQKARGYS